MWFSLFMNILFSTFDKFLNTVSEFELCEISVIWKWMVCVNEHCCKTMALVPVQAGRGSTLLTAHGDGPSLDIMNVGIRPWATPCGIKQKTGWKWADLETAVYILVPGFQTWNQYWYHLEFMMRPNWGGDKTRAIRSISREDWRQPVSCLRYTLP